jgi:3-oxoacyl-[acyl-carrier protein] reductase
MRILATGGLGALARSFAREATMAGAEVILADLLQDADTRGRGTSGPGNDTETQFMHCDVTDPDEVVALVEAAVSAPGRFPGRLDVVANFAGIHHAPFDLARDDPRDIGSTFERVIRVNLNGAFNVTAAAAKVMVRRRSGQIIHLCSNGSRASLYGSYAYNASKHGVEGLVKTAAAQLAPFGVRVNGIAPGTVITDLNRALNFNEDGDPRPRAKSILAHTPTKRFATAEGVAETLVAMCVPQRHATGNVVFCDDGYNVEGHSWPEGNEAVYESSEAVDRLYARLDEEYPGSDESHGA